MNFHNHYTNLLKVLETYLGDENVNLNETSEENFILFKHIGTISYLLKPTHETNHQVYDHLYYFDPLTQDNIFSKQPSVSQTQVSYTSDDYNTLLLELNSFKFNVLSKKLENDKFSVKSFQNWLKYLEKKSKLRLIELIYEIQINNHPEQQASYLWKVLDEKFQNQISIPLKSLCVPQKFLSRYSDFDSKYRQTKLIRKNYKEIKKIFEILENRFYNREVDLLTIQTIEGPYLDLSIKGDNLNQKRIHEVCNYTIGIEVSKSENQQKDTTLIASGKGIEAKEYKFPKEEIISILKRILLLGTVTIAQKTNRFEHYSFPFVNNVFEMKEYEENTFELFSWDVDNQNLSIVEKLLSGSALISIDEGIYIANLIVFINNHLPLIELEKAYKIFIKPDTFEISNINWVGHDLITCDVYFPDGFQNNIRPLQNVKLSLYEIPDPRKRYEKQQFITYQQPIEESGFQEIQLRNRRLRLSQIQLLLTDGLTVLAKRTIERGTSSQEEGIMLAFQLVNDRLELDISKTSLKNYISFLDNQHHIDGLIKAISEYFGSDHFTAYKNRRDAIRDITISLETLLEQEGFSGSGLGSYINDFVQKNFMTHLQEEWNYCYKHSFSTSHPHLNIPRSGSTMTGTNDFDQKWKDLMKGMITISPFGDRLILRSTNPSNRITYQTASLLLTVLCRNQADHKNLRKSIYTHYFDYRETIEMIIVAYFTILDYIDKFRINSLSQG